MSTGWRGAAGGGRAGGRHTAEHSQGGMLRVCCRWSTRLAAGQQGSPHGRPPGGSARAHLRICQSDTPAPMRPTPRITEGLTSTFTIARTTGSRRPTGREPWHRLDAASRGWPWRSWLGSGAGAAAATVARHAQAATSRAWLQTRTGCAPSCMLALLAPAERARGGAGER